MDIITVEDAQEFLRNQPLLRNALHSLFEISIENKKPLFTPEEVPELSALAEFKLLDGSPGNRYQFNFKSLVVCELLRELIETSLGTPLPAQITEALEYAEKFYLKIKEPKPKTSWYFHLDMEFDRYILVYLNQIEGIDVTNFYFSLTPELLDKHIPLRHLDTGYFSAFPYLTDDIPKCFETIKKMYEIAGKKEYAGRALSDIGKENPVKGTQLYDYGKANNAVKLTGFLPRLQIELYNIEPLLYFEEARTLFATNPKEGIVALAWLNYGSEQQITTAFELVSACTDTSAEYMRQLADFYPRLIEKKNTSDEVRAACFVKISEFLATCDDTLQHQMVWRFGLIEGYDAQKYMMLNQIINLNPGYMKKLFNRFDDPKYLFNLLAETYKEIGAAVEFGLFSESFSDMQHRHPVEFEMELLKLLTDDLAVVRLAGLMVLRSKYAGIYEVDFLKLPEAGQKRALETMLPHPHSIEELLPLVIKLRNSPYESVREILKGQLIELIWAYDHNVIDLVKKLLKEDDETDKKLLVELESAYLEFEQIKKQKATIQEFNPLLNELDDFEYYFEVEHELRAEQMEKATKRSIFTQLAKNISVIRGSAFKTEGATEITRMGTVSTSMLVDMRYYQNPDQYQWEYNQEMTGHNYVPEESAE